MWYLAITFLVGLAILAVFSSKENTIQAMTQAMAKQAVLKNSKILATRIKEWQHRPKTQNHSKHKSNKGARG